MRTNKNKYRPRTADTSIVTSENILTLTLLVKSTGYKHHCPPSVGLYDSITITMIYLAENLRQTTLATIFGVSQPTISRAITRAIAALDMILPPPPDPYDLDPHRYYVPRWNTNKVMELEEPSRTIQRQTCRFWV